MVADDRHDHIPVNLISIFIDSEQPVGIAVKRQPHIRLLIHDARLQFLHVRRTAVRIDIRAVWIIVYGHNLCAKLLERLHRSIVRSALRTVHHNLHTAQIHRNRLHRMIDILLPRVCAVLDLPHTRPRRKLDIFHAVSNQRLDLILH